VFIGATNDSRFRVFAGGRPHAPMGADLVEANVL